MTTSSLNSLLGKPQTYFTITKQHFAEHPKRVAIIAAGLALVIIGAGVGGGIAASRHHAPAIPHNATPTPGTFRPITNAPPPTTAGPTTPAPFAPPPPTTPAPTTPAPTPTTAAPTTPTPATAAPATPAPPNTPAGFREALNTTITEAVGGDPIGPVLNELTQLNAFATSTERQTIYDNALIQIATARATDILNAVPEQTYINLAFTPQTEVTLIQIFNSPPAKQRRQIYPQGPVAKAFQKYKLRENHPSYFGNRKFSHR